MSFVGFCLTCQNIMLISALKTWTDCSFFSFRYGMQLYTLRTEIDQDDIANALERIAIGLEKKDVTWLHTYFFWQWPWPSVTPALQASAKFGELNQCRTQTRAMAHIPVSAGDLLNRALSSLHGPSQLSANMGAQSFSWFLLL